MKKFLALSPLLVFLLVYLVSSIVAGDFYIIPVSSAFLVASVYAVLSTGGKLKETLDTFSAGAGNRNVLLMVWIFILAGAFAGTAKDIGAVDATVNATLSFISAKMIFVGLFLTACFISMSIGTSVGTIVALMPIASEIATINGVAPEFMAGLIVGGAFFGDNLSFISDTTIASTRAVGCKMADKFKVNIQIILPAVLIVSAFYVVRGYGLSGTPAVGHVEWIKMLPYILIIVLALLGRHVVMILTVGIVANAVIGFACGNFSWTLWLSSIGQGISSMNDLIVVTLLAGGLLEVMKKNGGLDYVIEVLTRNIKTKKGAQLSIAGLVSFANMCTANNTIAILTTGGIAKDISERFGLDARKTASILDTFSCFVQGIIPYGAQLLMASGLSGCSPVAIIPYLIYPFVMGIFALLAILAGYPKRYS